MRRYVALSLIVVSGLFLTWACSNDNDSDDDIDDLKKRVSDLESAGSDGATVKDANGDEIGTVVSQSMPVTFIQLSDGAIAGVSQSSGAYLTGACDSSFCNKSTYIDILDPQENYDDSKGFSYCYFEALNCSGTCLLPDKPRENFIFKSGASSYVKASGDETSSTVAFKSAYATDLTACIATTGDGATARSKTFYPVTSAYSFPSGITLPLAAPLTFE